MVFIKDYKGYLIIFLLTLVMGYFLGLMISTTVDYRLKNFVVNLPRPRNKIIVKLDKHNKIKKQKKRKRIVEGFTQNTKYKPKIKTSQEKTTKQFGREKVFNIENKREKEIKNMPSYKNILEDKNRDVYAKLYNKSSKKKTKDLTNFNFNAYNEEESDQIYTFLKPIKDVKSIGTVNKSESILKNIRKEVSNIKKLIPRNKRCPNFKCQKKWQNCTSKHRPIIKDNSFLKKIKKCNTCS